MGTTIEEVATTWLRDTSWQRVFKHTFDVIEDYVSYALVTVGAVSLSVRLLTTLSSGDLVCIIAGVANATDGSLGPYASGGTLGMIGYAQTEEACIRAVLTPFLEYLPYIMLLETLLLVVVEKFTFRIPRIAQKVERFYKNIVEESLFGKDPDAAEDMTDIRTSTEAISRKRQRIEICMSLKRGSIIHTVYIGKNVLEVLIVAFFFPLNLSYALIEGKFTDSASCRIPIQAFPELSIHEEGEVYFQCRGKKMSFFMLVLWVQNVLLAVHGVLSIGAIIWCWRFRAVTNLLRTIERMRNVGGEGGLVVGQSDEGKDFLFLFDLLAHSCGLEATLRVLTHSDENFYAICRPNLDQRRHLLLEEDKVKISWMPADIENWLHGGRRHTRSQRAIDLDCYEVTIFPAETVMNTQSISAKAASATDSTYSAWFYDLQGGRTEYVITIACVIGKSRMKGEKVVTNLVPYGPEKPRSGMVKQAGTKQVEIFWDPPKGEFTKYTLVIDRVGDLATTMGPAFSKSSAVGGGSNLNILPLHSVNSAQSASFPDGMSETQFDRLSLRHMENLSYKLTTYTILGLDPGEMYHVELGTKTGNVPTRQAITETVLTRPLPVSGLMASDVGTETCSLHWLPPEGHTCLRGFQLQVKQSEGKVLKNVAISKTKKTFPLGGMAPANDYDVIVTTLCVAPDGKRTESDPAVIVVTTTPDPVRNLHMENATPNSIVAKWDAIPAFPAGTAAKVRLKIECADIEYSASAEVPSDRNQYNFTKLPDPDGSGRVYAVTATMAVTTPRETEVSSSPATALVNTIPHRPANFAVGKNPEDPLEIRFARSATATVNKYRVRWKGGADEAKAEEAVFEDGGGGAAGEDGEVKFRFPQLVVGSAYRVNVYALAEVGDEILESKELHEKVILREDDNVLEVYIEEN